MCRPSAEMHTHPSFGGRVPTFTKSLGPLSCVYSQEVWASHKDLRMQRGSHQKVIRPHTHCLPRFTIVSFVTRWAILTLWEQRKLLLPHRPSSSSSLSVASDPFPNPNAGHWNWDSPERCCALESGGVEAESRKTAVTRGIRDEMDTYCRAWLSRGTRVSRKAHGALRREKEAISSLAYSAWPTRLQEKGPSQHPQHF